MLSPSILIRRQLLLLAGTAAQKISAAIIVVLLCRWLLPEEFGAYVVAMSLIEIAFLAIGFGSQTIMIRAVAQNCRLEDIYRSGVIMRAVATLPVALILCLVAWRISDKEGLALVLLMLPGMLAFSLAETPFAIILGKNRMSWKAGLDLVASLAGIAFMVTALVAGFGLKGAAVAFSLRRILNLLLAERACARLEAASLCKLWSKTKPWKEQAHAALRLWRDSASLGLAALAVTLHARWAPLLLAVWISRESAALFAGAWQIFEVIALIGTVMATAALPALASSYAAARPSGQAGTMLAAGVNVLTAIPVAAAVSAIAAWALPLALGSAYTPSVPILRVLLAAIPIIYFYETILNSLYADSRQNHVVIIRLIGLATSLGLNIILLPKYGIMGGAWAALINELLMGIMFFAVLPSLRMFLLFLAALATAACILAMTLLSV